MSLLRSHERRQRRLILCFRIERAQSLRLGGTKKALIGGDPDEVVAASTEMLGERQGGVQDDGVGGIKGVVFDVRESRDDERVGRFHFAEGRGVSPVGSLRLERQYRD